MHSTVKYLLILSSVLVILSEHDVEFIGVLDNAHSTVKYLPGFHLGKNSGGEDLGHVQNSLIFMM